MNKKFSERVISLLARHCAIALSLSVIILSACTRGSQSPIPIDKEGLIDVAQITQNVESFLGESVLVRNDAIETIGDRGLILDKDRAFSGETILVINTAKIPPIFSEDNTPEVLVRGKVERLILKDIESQYALNLDSSLYSQYEGKPVIIATSLIFSPDPEDLTRTPELYYGKYLAIKGEVEDIKSYGIFELDEEQAFGGEDLLVVQLKPKIKLEEEQTVIVYGVLRPLVVVELERDYDLGWDLSIQKQIEAEYSRKPALVAEKIQLLNTSTE